jgi:ribose/xylose/arabinose/galactoside ABC-type transport system permease subunit
MTLYSERQQGSKLSDYFQTNAHVLSIAAFLLACCALFTAINGVFISTGNLLNLLRQAAPTLIVSVAMTFVITTGGIDLSVGSIIALVIAAVVLGGTSLTGGRGTIVGTVLGALTISVISNGLILAHIDAFFTQIVTGAIILIAIWLNTRIFDHVGGALRRS